VAHLEGSAQAKQRLEVVLRTLAGSLSVQQACAELGLSPSRFGQLRTRLLQAALASLEPRPAGRPQAPATPAPVAELQQRVRELERQLHAALVREEVALILPRPPQPKKARGRRPRRSRRPSRPA
jgi:hypothetical protein